MKRRRKRATVEIFVSHATKDKWLAKAICAKIESTGAKTFRDDRDIKGGDDIPVSILNAIKRCDELIVLFTPESAEREWVRLEVGAAWGLEKRVIMVLCHIGVDPLPAMIKAKKAISLNDFDDYLAELKDRMERL